MRISIGFSSMDGIGPRAWGRDESKVALHTYHPHRAKHHPPIQGTLSETLNDELKRAQHDEAKQHKE